MLPLIALTLGYEFPRNPYLLGYSQEGEDLLKNGVVAVQEFLASDDEHPVPVEVAVEVSQLKAVEAQGGFLFWLTLLDFKVDPLLGGLPA